MLKVGNKVGSPQLDQLEMPPMDDSMSQPQGDMDMNLNMDGNDMEQMPPMENMDGNDENPYDTNFDAGIGTDEETDPKKYIQQLTGKLSQSLRQYNEGLPQPDVDLNKYVAGMINKQATDGLSQEDVDELLNKIKSDEITDDSGMDMQNESVKDRTYQINELFQQLTNNDEDDIQDKPLRNISYRKKPFTSPVFN